MIQVAASILAADFAKLADEIADVVKAGADWIHVDIMDGHFVPNISMGPLVVNAIRPHTKLPIDVHMMVEQPDLYIPAFVKAGADLISVHAEACKHLHRTVQYIKEQGIKAGVVLNPATPLTTIEHIIQDVDVILIMTVNPGFGGQPFIPEMLAKIKALILILEMKKLSHIVIEVDGGINKETAVQVIEAGATMLVAGQAIFGSKDRAKAISRIRG